jgi:ABC-type phosphate transport system permease subunit
MAQAVECLPSKCEVLNSNPSIVLAVLGFELRTYTLSRSTSPIFVMVFRYGVLRTICLGWL